MPATFCFGLRLVGLKKSLSLKTEVKRSNNSLRRLLAAVASANTTSALLSFGFLHRGCVNAHTAESKQTHTDSQGSPPETNMAAGRDSEP